MHAKMKTWANHYKRRLRPIPAWPAVFPTLRCLVPDPRVRAKHAR